MREYCFVNDDLHYSWWLAVDIDDTSQMQRLINQFQKEVQKRSDWYFAPEYFALFLEEKEIHHQQVDEEPGLVYWGE